MGENWQNLEYYAIVVRPFVGTENQHISVLMGDRMHIVYGNKLWAFGENLHTGHRGAVPMCCIEKVELTNGDLDSFYMQSADPLVREAKLTLKTALEQMSSAKGSKIYDLSEPFFEVVKRIDLYFLKGCPITEVRQIHRDLAVQVDNLRKAMGLTPPLRSENDGITTFTSWGQEIYREKIDVVTTPPTPPLYCVIKASMTITNLKKQLLFRYYIFKRVKETFTHPSTVILDQDHCTHEVYFDQIDKKELKDRMSLVVYAYELTNTKSTEFLREPVACAILEIPSYRNRARLNRQDVITGRFVTTTPECISKIHTHYLSSPNETVAKGLQPYGINIEVKFEAMFGISKNIVEKHNLKSIERITPVYLPYIIPKNEPINRVFVSLSYISQHSGHKKSSIFVRLLDKSSDTFIDTVENPVTGLCNSKYWESASFKGKEMSMNESFYIDLGDRTSFDGLYVVFEVSRRAITNDSPEPSSYAMAPVLPKDQNKTTTHKLYHFPKKGSITPSTYKENHSEKDVGYIDALIFTTSTSVPSNTILQSLFRKENLTSVFKDLTSVPESEYNKLYQQILFTLLDIMTEQPHMFDAAYKFMLTYMSDIIVKMPSENLQTIENLVAYSRKRTPELYKPLLEACLRSLQEDDTTPEFRLFLKSTPYLFRIACHSYACSTPNEGTFQQLVMNIFDKFNGIIRETASDEKRFSFVFINQSNIVLRFTKFTNALIGILPLTEIASIAANFVNSIAEESQPSKKQTVIDKNKMRLLQALAMTDLWKFPESQNMLRPVYEQKLNWALQLPHTHDYFLPIVAALFFKKRDDFITMFIPQLIEMFNESKTDLVVRLLLALAFDFPLSIPIDVTLKLIDEDSVPLDDRVTIFSKVVNFSASMIGQSMSKKLIFVFIELAVRMGTQKLPPLDLELSKILYPSDFDFSTINVFLLRLDKEDRLDPVFIEPLIHCSVLYHSKSLTEIFELIVQTSMEVKGNVDDLLRAVIKALWSLKNSKGFYSTADLFDGIDHMQPAYKASKSLTILEDPEHKLPESNKTQDAIVEALETLLNIFELVHESQMRFEIACRLVLFHSKFHNRTETAQSLLLLRSYCPNNNKLIHPKFAQRFPFVQAMNEKLFFEGKPFKLNRELYWHLTIKAVQEHQQEATAIALLEELREIYQNEFMNPEQFVPILNLEKTLYASMYESKDLSPKYFLFKSSNGGREFIYKRDHFTTLETFRKEMEDVYGTAQIEEVRPVLREELENLFFVQDSKKSFYLTRFELHQAPSIFISEPKVHEWNASKGWTQTIHHCIKSFPTFSTRIEVDKQQTTTRTLSAIQEAVMLTSKLNFVFESLSSLLETLIHQSNREAVYGTIMTQMREYTKTDQNASQLMTELFNAFVVNQKGADAEASELLRSALARHCDATKALVLAEESLLNAMGQSSDESRHLLRLYSNEISAVIDHFQPQGE